MLILSSDSLISICFAFCFLHPLQHEQLIFRVEQLLFAVDEESEPDELELDPYNPDHVDSMKQFIIDNHETNQRKNKTKTKTKNPIDKLIIGPNKYGTIDEFNHYLSSIIINILEYAEDNNKLFHLTNNNNTKHKRCGSSYDEMMRHIPRHSHYAFNPKLSSSSSCSYSEGINNINSLGTLNKKRKSKIFRSMLMRNENIEIISNLKTLIIDHFVNIESLKLIHDIVQLTKKSLINISFQFRFYNENDENHEKNNMSINSVDVNIYQQIFGRNSSYDNNMMISCISSILKLCEQMNNLESFNFNLIDFNRDCYDYFTHFDTESSDIEIFKNLKHLTIHIDDKLSQTEVSSFPFYAFAASPILAFLKKLKSLQSISIIIKDKKNINNNEATTTTTTTDDEQQYQVRIYFTKKLCEKIFEILNKSHNNLNEFYFKNIRNDCGSCEFFIELLINFIKSHRQLSIIKIILYDLCDENLANLIENIYYTKKYLQELSLCSQTCINSNTSSQSLRHHYGDISLSALLHLIYNSNILRKLSLICFYGADTIKFNALISAINTKTLLNNFEIAQLRKDSDTLYSLSKLFKFKNKNKNKLSWNFYESINVSFGAQFGHFYHGEKLQINEMKKFIDLILENQLLLQENKQNLLNLLSKKINKNFNFFMPNEKLQINEMKKFIDLILENQLLLQENKQNLLNLLSKKINKNFNFFMPNEKLQINE
eukprot:22104_1